MAMNALRDAAKESKVMKFVLGGFIFLAVGGLVFTDINGYFRGGLPTGAVAKVGDVEISMTEFDNGLRGFLQQAQLSAEDAYEAGLIDAYLQSRINSILEAQAADDLNIRASNALIARELKNVFANASRDEIEAALRARGLSEGQMALMIGDQIRTSITSALPRGVSNYVPPFMNAALTKANSERRSGTLYTFPAARLADDIEVTDEMIADYYANNQVDYLIPEERRFTIGRLTIDDIESTVPTPDAEAVRAEYDARIDEFTLPASRDIEQIVLDDPDTAQRVYEMVLDGQALKAAAQEVDADVSTYRPVAAYEQDGLPDELSDAAFAGTVDAGDVVAPVKTLIGWHVMKVTAINEAVQQPFDEVRGNIREAMVQQAQYDLLYDRIIRTEDMIDSGQTFTAIAKETGLKTEQTQSITMTEINELPDSVTDIIEQNPSVADEIFALNEGMASYPIETDDAGYIVIGVDSITQESYQPLDDVAASIRDTIKAQMVEQDASMQLEEIMARINDGAYDATDLANDYNAKRQSFADIGLQSDEYDTDLIFNTPLNGYNAAIDDNNNVQIATVTRVKYDDSSVAESAPDFATRMTNMFNAAQTAYYRENTRVTVNHELLAMQYGGE